MKNKINDMFAFENLYDDGEYYWFTSWSYNALFRMDKKNWMVEYIGSFPNEKLNANRLYANIVEYENKLYFTPSHAKYIGVYDKNSKIFSSIDYIAQQDNTLDNSIEWNFYPACEYNGCIYFFPHQRDYILKFEVTIGRMTRISFTNDDLRMRNIGGTWFFGIYVQDNIVYAPFNGVNAVLKLNMKNDEMNIYEVGEQGTGFADMCYDGENFWLVPMHGSEVVKWNYKKNTSDRIKITVDESGDYLFWGCNCLNNVVYLIPNAYSKILTIDIQNNTEYLITEYINIENDDKGIYYSNYIFCGLDKNYMLLFDKDTYLYEIDKEKNIIRKERLKLNPKNKIDYNTFISRLQTQIILDKEQTNYETYIFPLEDYIRCIINNN